MLAVRGFRLQFVVWAMLTGVGSAPHVKASTCSELSELKLSGARVVSAKDFAAGAFLPPGLDRSKPEAATYEKLPAFCRVIVEAEPVPQSTIPIEVWMPLAGWNGRFLGKGNGGFAGSFDYRGMAVALSAGYATAATDTGHQADGTDASWALGHPEQVIDFGYRAIHEMTGNAKTVIELFYKRPAGHAYFDACSDGGREALMEAQRFPQDYNGILAGAPANDWTHLITAGLAVDQQVLKDQASYVPLAKIPAINSAVLRACDAIDGVRDGVISDRKRCHFDPQVLLCRGVENDACLTAAQVKTVEVIYTGVKDSEGRLIFPPILPGSEPGDGGWKYWVTGESFGTSEGLKYPVGFFRNMVYEDNNWDWKTANVDDALKAADAKLAGTLNSTNPDLSAFRKRGGKLILYHGWLDPAISPLNTIDYYNGVVAKMGEQATRDFIRLYMVPGMQHCAGGPGPFLFGQLGIPTKNTPQENVLVALKQWVEHGAAPGAIIATKLKDDHDPSQGVLMTRPLCPYPAIDVYKGSGSTNEAGSFACAKK